MKRLIITINRFLAESCGYLLMIVMFLSVSDVLLRNFGFPIFGIVEVATFIVIAAVYFGLGHCEEEDGHVRIKTLLERMSPVSKQATRLVLACVTLAIMSLATYACARSAMTSYAINEAVMANQTALYSWPARTAVVVGLFFYSCQLVISISNEWRGLRDALAAKARKEGPK